MPAPSVMRCRPKWPAARVAAGLLLTLLPATATLIGLVVLRQVPRPGERAGTGLVIGGVALHRAEV